MTAGCSGSKRIFDSTNNELPAAVARITLSADKRYKSCLSRNLSSPIYTALIKTCFVAAANTYPPASERVTGGDAFYGLWHVSKKPNHVV